MQRMREYERKLALAGGKDPDGASPQVTKTKSTQKDVAEAMSSSAQDQGSESSASEIHVSFNDQFLHLRFWCWFTRTFRFCTGPFMTFLKVEDYLHCQWLRKLTGTLSFPSTTQYWPILAKNRPSLLTHSRYIFRPLERSELRKRVACTDIFSQL
jgi:hypothetical protein